MSRFHRHSNRSRYMLVLGQRVAADYGPVLLLLWFQRHRSGSSRAFLHRHPGRLARWFVTNLRNHGRGELFRHRWNDYSVSRFHRHSSRPRYMLVPGQRVAECYGLLHSRIWFQRHCSESRCAVLHRQPGRSVRWSASNLRSYDQGRLRIGFQRHRSESRCAVLHRQPGRLARWSAPILRSHAREQGLCDGYYLFLHCMRNNKRLHHNFR